MRVPSLLLLVAVAFCTAVSGMPHTADSKDAKFNPRIVRAKDDRLGKEFEYLVFDLGKGVDLKLVKISAREKKFTLGSSKEERDAVAERYFDGKGATLEFEAAHEITFTDDYYIGQFEMTRGQFRRFIEDSGYKTETETTDGGYGWNETLKKFEGRDKKYTWANVGAPGQSDDHPVTNITRKDAREFCAWLAKKADGMVRLRELRLPGEAEWEFACRAGGTGRFGFGDDEEKLAAYANVADAAWHERFPNPKAIKAKDGHVFAAPVGQFKPNAFGVYDMLGNVWEWVEDYYGKYDALPKERNQLQTKKQNEERPILRGGAYYTTPRDCRCATRYLVGIGGRYGAAGFRIVCVR